MAKSGSAPNPIGSRRVNTSCCIIRVRRARRRALCQLRGAASSSSGGTRVGGPHSAPACRDGCREHEMIGAQRAEPVGQMRYGQPHTAWAGADIRVQRHQSRSRTTRCRCRRQRRSVTLALVGLVQRHSALKSRCWIHRGVARSVSRAFLMPEGWSAVVGPGLRSALGVLAQGSGAKARPAPSTTIACTSPRPAPSTAWRMRRAWVFRWLELPAVSTRRAMRGCAGLARGRG